MREDNYLDEPTLDPVELERRSIAEANAEVLDEKRVRNWPILSALALAVSALSVVIYIAAWVNSVQDTGGPEGYVRITSFISTFIGAQIIQEGNGSLLYDPSTQRATQQRLRGSTSNSSGSTVPYDELPFEAMIIAPIAALPSWVAFAFWTLAVGGFAIGMAVGFMDGALPVSRHVGWALSLAACSYFPVVRTLMLGEDSAFILMGLCGLYMALKGGHEVLAACALVVIALKPQLLPALVLLLLLQSHFKTLVLFFVFLGTLSVAAIPVVGVTWPLHYLQFLAGPLGWGDNGGVHLTSLHNLRGLSEIVLGGAAPALVTPVFVLLSLASLAIIVWAWRRSRANQDVEEDGLVKDYEPHNDLLWALTGVVVVLTAVQLTPQDLTLLVFPAWIIGAHAAQAGWGRGLSALWLAVLWAGYALAPLTLYSTNTALSVVPIVLLMILAVGLLVWLLAGDNTLNTETDEAY